jgi:hypothetical protein
MQTKTRSTLTRNDLDAFKAELLRMYRAHEITADEYATLTEDIAVIERGR